MAYYVDPLAIGGGTGVDWTNAWVSIQSAYDTAIGGDIVYCRGVETLAATIDIDVNSGSSTGFIKFIGCNASGVVDGTRYVLDGNSTALYCIKNASGFGDYYWHENFEFKNAVDDGVNCSLDIDYCFWINCISHNNGDDGFTLGSGSFGHTFIFCQSYNNTGWGWYYPAGASRFVFCIIYNNGDDGFYQYGHENLYYGCIIHDNGDSKENINIRDGSLIMNCVIDGTDQTNGIGINSTGGGWFMLLGNRITNLTTGVDCNSDIAFLGWNYFHNNTNDTIDDTLLYNIPYDDKADTNEYDIDADDGYNDVANHDFNLKAARTLRLCPISLNLGITEYYIAAGLSPNDTADDGPSKFYITAGLPPATYTNGLGMLFHYTEKCHLNSDSSFTPPANGTVCFWAHPICFRTDINNRIIGCDDAWEILFNGTTLRNELYGGASPITLANMLPHTLYHITCTYNSSNAGQIYIDGVLEASGSGQDGSPSSDILSIGNNYDGYIDDIRIYNRVLTADEIQTIYSDKGCDGIAYGLLHKWVLGNGPEDEDCTTFKDIGPEGLNLTWATAKPHYRGSRLKYRRFV